MCVNLCWCLQDSEAAVDDVSRDIPDDKDSLQQSLVKITSEGMSPASGSITDLERLFIKVSLMTSIFLYNNIYDVHILSQCRNQFSDKMRSVVPVDDGFCVVVKSRAASLEKTGYYGVLTGVNTVGVPSLPATTPAPISATTPATTPTKTVTSPATLPASSPQEKTAERGPQLCIVCKKVDTISEFY